MPWDCHCDIMVGHTPSCGYWREPVKPKPEPEQQQRVEVIVRGYLDAVEKFKAEMTERGFHIGWGESPRCLVCDEPWPCRGARPREDKMRRA